MNATRICTIDTCDRRHFARGFCRTHYTAAMRSGEISSVRKTFRGPLSERLSFYSRSVGSCRIWTGATDAWGYGKVRVGDRTVGAHRAAYELTNGRIPDGLVLDHTCRTPSCINPGHLRLATTKENAENLSAFSSRSSSGHRGVSWSAERKKWHAAVKHNGKTYFAGDHARLDDAVAAVTDLRLRLFTHNDDDRAAATHALEES